MAPTVVHDAIRGDRGALRAFVAAMSPVIQARVVRGLLRRRPAREHRDIRQEVEDMTQEVFGALFAHDARALRAWDPERGLSLANFVGLIADRQVVSILRSNRRNPWQDVPEELDDLERGTDPVASAAPQLESRRTLELLLDRMREALSPRGLELFQRLYVDEEPIEEVAQVMGMTRDAVYAWRNRVTKIVQRFAAEIRDDGSLDVPASRRNSSGATDDE